MMKRLLLTAVAASLLSSAFLISVPAAQAEEAAYNWYSSDTARASGVLKNVSPDGRTLTLRIKVEPEPLRQARL